MCGDWGEPRGKSQAARDDNFQLCNKMKYRYKQITYDSFNADKYHHHDVEAVIVSDLIWLCYIFLAEMFRSPVAMSR